MRYSADSDDYGVTRRGNNGKKRGKFYDDERTYVKRDRHLPRLAEEDADDATDGLPEGDRWSTWDQTQNLISTNACKEQGHTSHRRRRHASWMSRPNQSRPR